MNTESSPLFVHITGSAEAEADAEQLRAAHVVVTALVEQALAAGGGCTLFLGPEPRSSVDATLPLVFDGTVLRCVVAWVTANPEVQRTVLRVVTAPKHLDRKAPRESVEQLRKLRDMGAVEVRSIPDEAFAGESLRKAILERTSAVVGLSGGKGVTLLFEAARAQGVPFVPVDVDLGSSLNDGRGARGLFEEFTRTTARFLPTTRPAIAPLANDLSIASPLGGPATVAKTVWGLLQEEHVRAVRSRLYAVVVTVLPVELKAAAQAFAVDLSGKPEHTSSGTAYWRGGVAAQDGMRTIALTCLGTAGNVNAAAMLMELVHRLEPGLVVVCGIAAGRRGKRKLGECVVAERVVAYEGAADKDVGMGRRPSMLEAPHGVRQFLAATLATDVAKALSDRWDQLGGDWPAHEDGALSPALHIGTIAAGEKLLRRAGFWDELALLHDKIEAAEMEGHGVAVAASLAGVPWLLVRGVSDFGDADKNDLFHGPAALAAACAAVELIARSWASLLSPRRAP